MKRILISETIEYIDKNVQVGGWVNTRRDHGKIVFLDIYDRSGVLQVVASKEQASELRPQDVVIIEGKVAQRPEKLINKLLKTGAIELQSEKIEVLSKASELPFDMGTKDLNLQLPTLLDFRALTLRHSSIKSIFKIQACLLENFRRSAKELDCTEIVVPTVAASATEGGAEVFRVDYYGYKGYLTQSPQLYKQIMVGALERVFTVTKAYRAEPSVTTRHISEATQMDCEIGFMNFEELLDSMEYVGSEMLKKTIRECQDIFKELNIELPKLSKIPRLKLTEAQEIIFNEYGRDVRGEKDLSPQDEFEISKWAREKHNSDLVTITHFPTKKRAFYTMPDPENPEYSLSYDILFRGLEVCSGSQRINDYNELVTAIKDRGMDPANFEMYLMSFLYGMPPEGGFSYGLERMTMQLLNLNNVREASLFPRDMERVDVRLSTLK